MDQCLFATPFRQELDTRTLCLHIYNLANLPIVPGILPTFCTALFPAPVGPSMAVIHFRPLPLGIPALYSTLKTYLIKRVDDTRGNIAEMRINAL